jgi:hypothetical protein
MPTTQDETSFEIQLELSKALTMASVVVKGMVVIKRRSTLLQLGLKAQLSGF